jgi:hypothetical protein
MAGRLLEIDCNRDEGLTIRLKPRTLSLLPESTRGHLRAANKELLLALRSVIDSAIEYTEQQEQRGRPRRRIQVKVDDNSEERPERS